MKAFPIQPQLIFSWPFENLIEKAAGILKLYCLFLALIFSVADTAFSQVKTPKDNTSGTVNPPSSLYFEHLTVADGLAQGSVYTIYQDSRGFIWFGTQSGLSRYDGYSFTTYETIPFDSTSLQGGWITTISEGKDGTLWIGTTGGVSRFDPSAGTFRRYPHTFGDSTALTSDFVSDILVGQSGMIWISTGQGLTRLNPENGEYTRYFYDSNDRASLTNNELFSLYQDSSGILWIGSVSGLNRFNPQTGRVRRYLYEPGVTPTETQSPVIPQFIGPSGIGMDIYADPKKPGILWMTGMGLIRFDTGTGEYTRYLPDPLHPENLTHNSTLFVAPDPRVSDVLWITTWNNGLLRFDMQTEKFTRYLHDPNDQNSLSDDDVFSIYTGRTGTVWIGIMAGGVNRFDPRAGGMTHYRHIPGNPNSLSNNSVWSIFEDHKGVLWIGTFDGRLNRINQKTGVATHYQLYSQDAANECTTPLGRIMVRSIYEDSSGRFWIGTSCSLIRMNRPDASGGTFTHYRHDPQDPNSLTGGTVGVIYEDRAGTLWIGMSRGLNRMDCYSEASGGQFTRFVHDPDDTTSLVSNDIYALYEDLSGTLWIGTDAGLSRMNRAAGTFTNYTYDPDDPKHSISWGWILSIHERKREPGVLWIGQEGGLTRFDTRTETFTHYTVEDGLPDNTVYGILEDAKGRLWLSTNQGISCFDPEAETFTNYGLESGLQALEFNSWAYFEASNGKMFFGGVNGVSAFYPTELQGNTISPQVALTGLELFNRPVTPGPNSPLRVPLTEAEEIKLEYDQNTITFEYVGLHYTNPEEIEYAYMLKGLNAEWLQAGTMRTVTYANLDPGEYTFKVKAANSNGVWSKPVSLPLTITPPWWRTWLAYVLYIVGLIGFVFGIVKWRSYQLELEKESLEKLVSERTSTIEQQAERLKEQDEAKSRFFANISHEFRTPLTLILGEITQLEKNKLSETTQSIYQVMRRNGKRLLTLVNQLLDLSSLEAGKMKLDAVKTDLITFLKPIAAAYDSLAKSKDISFSFKHEEEHIPIYLDLDKMEKVIHNLLSNAFKFTGENGVIKLKASTEKTGGKSYAIIEVEDNGPGIPVEQQQHIFDRFYQVDDTSTRQQEGTGIGLALAGELTDLHHGEISLISNSGEGAVFTVLLPLGKDHLSTDEVGEPTVTIDGREKEGTMADAVLQPQTENGSEMKEREALDENAPCILVVEDNADMQEFICKIITPHYRFMKASDGLKGWQKATDEIPDLIISDVMMPKMDGLELCRKLKNDERTSHIPVVLLTAKAGKASKMEGLETRADSYLTKPFNRRELLVRMKNLITQRRQLREKYSRTLLLEPTQVAVSSLDEQFLQKVKKLLEDNLADENFSVPQMQDALAMSKTQLHRKMKALTDQPPGAFLRNYRLKRAAQILEQQGDSVTQIAYAVGFNNLSYFTKCFKELYGVAPSEYKESSVS